MGRRTFLVSGATGRQGGAVARSLLKRGHAVRALTRDPGSALTLRTLGAEVVEGDLRTGQGLAEALRGVEGFFLLTTPFDEGPDDPDFEGEKKQGQTALRAAKTAATSHVILSSAAPASGDSAAPMFEAKLSNERLLGELGLPGTIVRPSTFMDNFTASPMLESLRGGILAFPAPPETRLELVCVNDLGEAAASAFELGAGALGETIDLTGDSHTFHEIARMLGSWLGRSVRFQEETDAAARKRFGRFPEVKDNEAERKEIDRQIEAVERRWGLHMTSFATFLASTPVPRLESDR